MRPTFDAALIGELRSRVIRHNEAHPQARAKLGDLIKAYERGFRRTNPGARAMEKVDTLLDTLAKADDFDETAHPRGHAGEFSRKGAARQAAKPTGQPVRMTLPRTEAEHQSLQGRNAGYKAMTSDVIPERRNEAIGSVTRDGGSLLAGTAIVAGLARNRPGSMAERVAGKAAGTVAGLAAGGAAGLAGQGLHFGSSMFHNATGIGPVFSSKRATAFQAGAAKVAYGAGSKLATGVARVAGHVVRGTLNTAGNGPTSDSAQERFRSAFQGSMKDGKPFHQAVMGSMAHAERLDRRVKGTRKALAFGALAIGAGALIRNRIKDTIVDPQEWGRSIDAYSFRTVQKAVGSSGELGELRKNLTTQLGQGGAAGGSIDGLRGWLEAGAGGYGTLEKAGVWGPGARRIFAGTAGLVGAGAGAGAGYYASRATEHHFGAQPGQFEEEEHPRAKDGKFTSKSGRDHKFAQVGAVLGGAAAGIAAWTAIRRHNGKAFAQNIEMLRQAVAQRRATDGMPGHKNPLSQFLDRSAERADEKLKTGKEFKKYRDTLAAVASYGPSSVPVMQEKLKDAFFHKMANILSVHPDMRIPDGNGWKTITQIKAKAILSATASSLAHSETVVALRKMDEGQLRAAMKALPQATQDKALEVWGKAHAAAGDVEAQLAGHSAATTAAEAHAKAEGEKLGAASKVLEEAQLDVDTAAADQLVEANKGLAKAKKVHGAAATSSKSAEEAYRALKNNPTGVVDPYTGRAILPATTEEIDAIKSRLTDGFRKKADATVEEENLKFRAEHHARLDERERNVKAALAAEAALNGSPRSAARANKALRSLHLRDRAAQADLRAAAADHAVNQIKMDRLTMATKVKKPAADAPRPKKGAAPDYIDPPERKMSANERDNLRANAAFIRTKFQTTALRLDKATKDAVDIRTKRNAALDVLDEAMRTEQVGSTGPGLMDPRTKRDLARAWANVRGPAMEFLRSPSGAKLREFYDAIGPTLKDSVKQAYGGAKAAAGDIYNDYFTRDDGKGGKRLDIPKVILHAAPFAALVGAAKVDVVNTAESYLHPDPQKREEARKRLRNLQVDSHTDPIDGSGYFAVSLPDPKLKGERRLLFGERYDNSNGISTRLHGGATMSDVRRRIAERQAERERRRQEQLKQQAGQQSGANSVGVGTLSSLSGDDRAKVTVAQQGLGKGGHYQTLGTFAGGPTVQLRKADHEEQNDRTYNPASQVIIDHLRSKHNLLSRSPTTPEAYHAALADLFSSEASVLKGKQAYREMTGFDTKGGANQNGKGTFRPIVGANPGFGSQDAGTVLGALKGEVDRVLRDAAPKTVAQAANLHRVIAVVQAMKHLDRNATGQLHQQVEAATAALRAAQPAPAPFAAGTPAAAAAATPAGADRTVPVTTPDPTPIDLRESGKDEDGANAPLYAGFAKQAAKRLAAHIGVSDAAKIKHLGLVIHGLARSIPDAAKLDEEKRTIVVENALTALHERKPASLGAMMTAGPHEHHQQQDQALQSLLTSQIMVMQPGWKPLMRAALLDDVDALLKLSMGEFEEALHPRAPAGASGGGEFTTGDAGGAGGAAGGGHGGEGVAGKAASEVIEAGGKFAGKAQASVPQTQSWANPVRMGAEVGGSLGSEVGIKVAQAVTHFLPGAAGKALGWVADGAAAMYAGDQGSQAGEAAGQAIYRKATGSKAAPEYAPPDQSVGQSVVGGLGGMAGGVWGNAAGQAGGKLVGAAAADAVGMFAGRALGGVAGSLAGPVGSVLVGTAAGYAGEKIASGIYGLFAGYDKPKVDAVLSRYGAKPRAVG